MSRFLLVGLGFVVVITDDDESFIRCCVVA
jgi:hypothetical protein